MSGIFFLRKVVIMKIERFGTDKKGLYSDVSTGNGEIYISAQTAYDSDGNFIGEKDAALQTKQACKNVVTLLDQAGADISAICKVNIYVPDQKDCQAVIQTVAESFKELQPSMSCICVDLEEERMLVKLDVEAYKG